MKLSSPADTQDELRAKADNEVELAGKLRDLFDASSDLMPPLRALATCLVQQINALAGAQNLSGPVGIAAARTDKLGLWGRGDPTVDLATLRAAGHPGDGQTSAIASVTAKLTALASATDLDATTCGELLRLFVWVARVIGQAQQAALDDASFVIADAFPELGADLLPTVDALKAASLSAFGAGGSEQTVAAWWNTCCQYRSPWQLRDLDGPSDELDDTVRAIERLFGLPIGTDVFGLGAAMLFTLESVLPAVLGGDPSPLSLLLPIASMVPSGNNTIVELALTLTMNSYLTYAVGFYSNLYPGDTDARKKSSDTLEKTKSDIKEALQRAEVDPRNRLMLAFRTSDGQRRVLCTESEEEKQQFRLFAAVTPVRYNYFAVPRTIVASYRDQRDYTSSVIEQVVSDMTSPSPLWQQELEVIEGL